MLLSLSVYFFVLKRIRVCVSVSLPVLPRDGGALVAPSRLEQASSSRRDWVIVDRVGSDSLTPFHGEKTSILLPSWETACRRAALPHLINIIVWESNMAVS